MGLISRQLSFFLEVVSFRQGWPARIVWRAFFMPQPSDLPPPYQHIIFRNFYRFCRVL